MGSKAYAMSLSLTEFSYLLGLTMALAVSISSARPVRRQVFTVPERQLLAFITGQPVHVDDDGNVTAKEQDGNKVARFHYNQHDEYILFQSADFNGSFLHFVEIISSTNDTLEFSGYNQTQYNATEYNSTEEYASGGGNETNTVPVLKLIVGELDDEEGVIRHHMWMEVPLEPLEYNLYTYSVRPNNETVCYLAFEADGSPVSNPCDESLANFPRKIAFDLSLVAF